MHEPNQKLSDVRSFRVGNHLVEPSALRVIGDDGETVRLESKAMQVLVYLASNPGRVISREELEEKIWEGRIVGEDALTNTISKLRRAFVDDARNPSIIETVPKTGYRLLANVDWDDGQVEQTVKVSAPPGRVSPISRRTWIGALVLISALIAVTTGLIFKQQVTPDSESSIQIDVLEEKPAVAIVPFENLEEEPGSDYFANGITVNLITDLSKVSGLLVIAPGSVFSYKDNASGTQQISRELNVDYVVRGSVQRHGEQVRVNVQLIEATNESAIWAERYDSNLTDVFKLQDQMASALVAALKIELTPGEKGIFSRYPTANVQAYDLFLRGLEEYGHRTPDSNQSARTYFEQAVELDPGFARAITGLALVHLRDAIDGWTSNPTHSLDLASDLAVSAAKINPAIPQVHFVTAQVALFREQHTKAIKAIQQAIQYSPNYADAYALLAWILNYAGQSQKALDALQTAMRLNPVIPASYSEIHGEIHFLQGNYIAAITAFENTLQINPSHMRARMWLIATFIQTSSLDEAQWQAGELTLLYPDFSLTRLQYAFPFRNHSVRNKLLQSLDQAGLPK